ncbi:unnamed protein product [Acanthocheilonema viteae]|uniref:Uncharacterized protein n=1 Tax=Acanthocheilonema viteae TaxID=6277 RepID=A0A498STA3_ACAVI|nr:unnamed protein product [Acanthocheilonema viteae]
MASMPKRRRTGDMDDTETILLGDDLKQIKDIVMDFKILNDVLCILTNIYEKMPYLCCELAEPPGNFTNIAVRLLECGPKISLEAKCEIFRLICSVAIDQRCMEMITENTHLVDRIAMAIDHEVNEVAKVALQTAGVLSVNKNGIRLNHVIWVLKPIRILCTTDLFLSYKWINKSNTISGTSD